MWTVGGGLRLDRGQLVGQSRPKSSRQNRTTAHLLLAINAFATDVGWSSVLKVHPDTALDNGSLLMKAPVKKLQKMFLHSTLIPSLLIGKRWEFPAKA